MECQIVEQVSNATKPALRIFESNPPNQPVNFVSERKQVLRQVTSILSGNAGDEDSLLWQSSSPAQKVRSVSPKTGCKIVNPEPTGRARFTVNLGTKSKTLSHLGAFAGC